MTGEEAIAYIHAHHWQNSRPGLYRMRRLLALLGDPQEKLKFVHVAGTNGKGSTCACLASILQAAGFRVGLNTSPYIRTFEERIQVNGENIPGEELGFWTETAARAADKMEEPPTEFELITAIAFLYFLHRSCEIVVLEVGLGGALDASNVISVPEAAVITALGMDHESILGHTLPEIAAAKAGIIKEGGSVVSYGGVPEADAVIRRTCRQCRAELREVDFTQLHIREMDLEGSRFDFAEWTDLYLPLAGSYQPKNAAVALTAVQVLREKGWSVPDSAIRQGLARVRWLGRFELLRRGPVFLLDGAHNPHGIAAAADSLRTLLPGQKLVFLLGILADKDAGDMVRLLTPLAQAAVAVQPDSPRAMAAENLCRLLREAGVPAQSCGSVAEGVALALREAGENGAVCALGSLYFSADVRRAVLGE